QPSSDRNFKESRSSHFLALGFKSVYCDYLAPSNQNKNIIFDPYASATPLGDSNGFRQATFLSPTSWF
ncbi:MAG: hypothetical protein KJZ64_09850, partial [Sphingomonadaceae bacterium]|nr:hypothetical protein [Sphingomonadaceae bacterium]